MQILYPHMHDYFYTHTQTNNNMPSSQHVCWLMDSLKLNLMFMNVQDLCISIVLFVKLVNWPTFRYSPRSVGCIIARKRLNIFLYIIIVENSACLSDRAF